MLVGSTLSWIQVIAPVCGLIAVTKGLRDYTANLLPELFGEKSINCKMSCGYTTPACCGIACILAIVFTVASVTNFSQEQTFYTPAWISENFSTIRTNDVGILG
jgi:hypothetical protein